MSANNLPYKPIPTDRPDRDWLIDVANLLEWVCNRCNEETRYLLTLADNPVADVPAIHCELRDRLTFLIEGHRGQLASSETARNAIGAFKYATGYSLAAVLTGIRDHLDGALQQNETRPVPLLSEHIKAAQARFRILREDTQPTLAEQARGGAGPKSPPTDPKAPACVLHPDDVKILAVLAKKVTTQNQYDLEETSGLSRRTISGRLDRLRDSGLTHRPNGERGGEAITQAGRDELLRNSDQAAH